jgi:cytochrome P450 family 710 subfamily A protein
MPPRENTNTPTDVTLNDATDSSTQSVTDADYKSSDAAPPKTKKTWNTFHYELNVYSFGFLFILFKLVSIPPLVAQIVLALIALDAAKYYYYKGSLAGAPYTLPFVSLIAMVIKPTRFWGEMANIAMQSQSGMCTNILVGNFMVFCTDPQLCREIMTGEGSYGIYAHPNAMWLFDPDNLIYLDKEPHKKFRAILTPALFSNEALAQYAQAQEQVVRAYMRKYLQHCQNDGHPQTLDLQIHFRSMAAASSQESFIGPYLTDAIRKHLEEDILIFTMGFLCFPFPYFFGLSKALQAKHRIETTVREIVPKARAYIAQGNTPRCMMEHWCQSIVLAAKEEGCEPHQVAQCGDDDIARSVLDFMFAAQDATNSALAASVDVLDAHRDVLDKLRHEIDATCGPDGQVWKHCRQADNYLAKVANQLLHHKPPVPMIPHITKKAVVLGGHVLPKGCVAIPSIQYSARASGASLEFLPEREDHDSQFVKTVVFGAGQHKCPGRRYAESLLTVFLAVVAQEYDFHRTGPRPSADEFIYFPTIFPQDCNFVIKQRE